MSRDDYPRICERIARKAIQYAAQMASEESLDNVTNEREHWIDVYLDERLPEFDDDFILDMTRNADAFEKSAGYPAPSRQIAARHALQADVWDSINKMS